MTNYGVLALSSQSLWLNSKPSKTAYISPQISISIVSPWFWRENPLSETRINKTSVRVMKWTPVPIRAPFFKSSTAELKLSRAVLIPPRKSDCLAVSPVSQPYVRWKSRNLSCHQRRKTCSCWTIRYTWLLMPLTSMGASCATWRYQFNEC